MSFCIPSCAVLLDSFGETALIQIVSFLQIIFCKKIVIVVVFVEGINSGNYISNSNVVLIDILGLRRPPTAGLRFPRDGRRGAAGSVLPRLRPREGRPQGVAGRRKGCGFLRSEFGGLVEHLCINFAVFNKIKKTANMCRYIACVLRGQPTQMLF